MNKIADYDELDYDYSTYWKKRHYEHLAEVLLLKKLLKGDKGKWFLDIGGSFGRLLDTYYKKYKRSVIVDYSLKTLQKNAKSIKSKYPNVEMIAANAYYLPFKENTFDGALMVRVLHHLSQQEKYFSEVFRVVNSNGKYIQEFANKLHIKAVIKNILKLNFEIFNTQPYQQPDMKNNEGARENSNVPFLNYHIKFVSTLLKKKGFKIVKKYGCSFLRLNLLKKIFNIKQLLTLENILQNTLSFTNISPSIFIKCIKGGKENIPSSELKDILVCPSCKESLSFLSRKAVCKECKREYIQKKNIWDFRV